MGVQSRRFVVRALRGLRGSAVESLEGRSYLTGVTLGSPVSVAASVVAGTAHLVDLNGDGKADLYYGATQVGGASFDISLSNTAGSFGIPTLIPLNGTITATAAGQFDSFGHTDLLVATSGSPGEINLFLNDGQGNLSQGVGGAGLADNSALAVGDFNNDGHTDVLAVSNSASNANNAMLLLGDSSPFGVLNPQAPFSLPFGSVAAVAVGDFNGDGNLDFVVASPLDKFVTVFLGNGNGTFQAPNTFATGPGPTSIVVGDFNGQTLANGKPALDIVTADSTGNEISFLDNNGSGGFNAPVNSMVAGTLMNGGPTQIVAANFSGTSTPQDLVALLSSGSTNEADVLLGNGDGTFRSDATIAPGDGTSIVAGDIKGSGPPDEIVIAGNSQISTYPTTFQGGSVTPTPSPLVPSLGKVKLAATVVAGNKLNASLPVVVTNSGTLPKGKVTFSVYANTAASLDGNQVLLSSVPKPINLKTGRHSSFNFAVKSLPASLPAGDYHLLVELTDATGATNLVATTQTVQVSAPFVLPGVTVTPAVPATIIAGKSGSLTVVITNLGNIASTIGQLTFTLSTDGITPIAGVTLATLKTGFKIQPQKSKKIKLHFKLVAGFAAGTYYPFAEVSLNGVSTTAAAVTPFIVP